VPAELSDDELKDFHAGAERAAAKVSRDREVVGEAADFAVAELVNRLGNVSSETPARKAWVAVVARNHALRVGKKLHRDLAMGRAGSLPPPMPDEQEAERVELLIGEMRSGGGPSLGSFVADKVDFENAWALISEQDRLLLDLKYAEGLTSKEIAEKLGKKPGTIDNQLTAAKKAAVLLFADMLGDFDHSEFDE
jgi:RNA polymerase sigma factor (sigma-70 family)